MDILNVPKIHKKLKGSVIMAQFATTFSSIFFALLTLYIESNGLKEKLIEYVMLSLKAKQDWVPYGNRLKTRSIGMDIDYGLIEFKIPILTDLFGKYLQMEY